MKSPILGPFIGERIPGPPRLQEKVLLVDRLMQNEFLKARPLLDSQSPQFNPALKAEFDLQVEALHLTEGKIAPVSDRRFWLSPETVPQFNRLKEEHLTPDYFAFLADQGYSVHGYASKSIASDQTRIRDFSRQPHEVPGLAHLHRGNDFAAAMLYLSNREQIARGHEVHLLDLGAGTGGTTESLVHFFHSLATQDGLLGKLMLVVYAVEQNEQQAEAWKAKANLLAQKYRRELGMIFLPVTIRADAISILGEGGEYLDGAVASYALHHLRSDAKRHVATETAALLKPGKLFVVNDCDGRSEINQSYFNFLSLVKHPSIFDTLEETAGKLADAGLEIATLSNKAIRAGVEKLFGGERLDVMDSDQEKHVGYSFYGERTG